MAGARLGPGPWWRFAAVLVAVLVNVPLVYLAVRAFGHGLDGVTAIAGAPSTLRLLGRTTALAAGTVAASILIAVPFAWLVTWTDLPARRFWGMVGALPLVFPSYLAALVLVSVAGPRGSLQGLLETFGVDRLPEVAYGYSGALLALAPFVYPYLYLLLIARLRELDPALLETSRSLGSSSWDSFRRIVLPQIRPAVLGGSLLIALYAASDFGAVSLVRYDTFTLSIYNAYRGLFDRTTAAVLALLLVSVTLLVVALEGRLLGTTRSLVGNRVRRDRRRFALGRWKAPAVAFVGLVGTMTVGLPIAVLVAWGWSGLARSGADSSAPLLARSLEAAASSFGVSLGAALLATILAVPVVWWAVRGRGALPRVVERICLSGHALPGIVVALALVFFATRALPWLYQTSALLVFAYVVRFLPEALRAQRASFLSFSPRLEEVAHSLGKTPRAVMTTVTLPLVRRGLLAGAGLVFLTAMKELPATLILAPIGFESLATLTWSAASEGIYSRAALPGLLLLAVTAVPITWLVVNPMLRD